MTTKQSQVQRLKRLAQLAAVLECDAHKSFNRHRASHFMIKRHRLTKLAIQANQEAK